MENQEILVAVGAIIGALMSGVQIIGKWREEHRAEAKNNPRNAWKGRLASFAERLTQLVVVTVDHIPCSYMTVLVQRAPQGPSNAMQLRSFSPRTPEFYVRATRKPGA